jgi:hypothetical protein
MHFSGRRQQLLIMVLAALGKSYVLRASGKGGFATLCNGILAQSLREGVQENFMYITIN